MRNVKRREINQAIKKKYLAKKIGKSYNILIYMQNKQQDKLKILFKIAGILEINSKELIKETK
jgi:hypothetical protein